MAGFSIKLDIDAKPLKGGLAALRKEGANPRDAWDAIGRRWVALTQERFVEGNTPDGTPWKPSLRAQQQGGQTLLDNTDLQGSITHEPDDGGVTIGTNKIYARPHQLGAVIVPVAKKFLRFFIPGVGQVFARKVVLPPRPFIGINDSYLEEFAEILANRLRRIVEAARNGGGEGASA